MYKLNDSEMFYDIADGQAVVINFVTGVYYGTTMLGSEVLDRLVAGKDPARIEAAVRALPGCPDDFHEKLGQFIGELEEKKILVREDSAGTAEGAYQSERNVMAAGGDEPMSESVLADGFDLTLDEYDEVQDLILADPIHDVDIEQGWPVLNGNAANDMPGQDDAK